VTKRPGKNSNIFSAFKKFNLPLLFARLSTLEGMGQSQRHIPMPEIAVDGELFHECLMFMFAAISCALQFLHLYRSVWWLPMSNSKYAMVMKFILIST